MPEMERRYICGLLDDLWSWALDVVKLDGRLEGLSSEDIASVLGFQMDFGKQLMEALVSSGFVDVEEDGTYRLHDWADYAGRYIIQHEKDAARKRAERQRSAGCPHDILGTSLKCPQDVLGMSACTEPNNTLPNNTLPNNIEHVVVDDDDDDDDSCGNLRQSAADCGDPPQSAASRAPVESNPIQNYNDNHNSKILSINPSGSGGGCKETKVDVLTYAKQNLLSFKNGTCTSDIRDFMEQGVEDDAIRFAIDQAVNQGKTTWSYVVGVVNQMIARGIKTAPEARAAEKAYQMAKAKGGAIGGKRGGNPANSDRTDSGRYDAEEIARISKLDI